MIKKNNRWWIFFLFLTKAVLIYYLFCVRGNTKKNKIVILQTARHPALDLMVTTIIENIKDFCQSQKYDIELKNGDGNILNIEMIAQELIHNKQVKKIIAIGSPALQSLISLAIKYEKKVPLIFGAVTNPELCNINSYQYVSGVSDQINFHETSDLLAEIGVNKKIGFLYTVGDVGSQYTLSQLKKDLRYELIPFGCNCESDVIQVVELASQKVDILFIPTDNMIAGAINTIFSTTKKYNKKLFMTDKTLFDQGGDYFCGVDYKKHALEIGQLVAAE